MFRCLMLSLLFSLSPVLGLAADAPSAANQEGWVSIFDGRSFEGWKVTAENKESWAIEDGALKAKGERAHLFYVGDEKPFKNFEFRCEVKTLKGSNGGIYFHTRYQERGWPKYGFEAQVNNTHPDPRKTGSLYGVMDVTTAPAADGEWFTEYVKVEGKRIIIKINDKVVVDYTEPDDKRAGEDFTRKIDEGTFALQAHDPHSTVYFRKIEVKRLP